MKGNRRALRAWAMLAWLPAQTAFATAPGSSSVEKRPADVDLDLHRSPPAPGSPKPTPAGAVLGSPQGAGPAVPYQLRRAPDGGYLYRGPTFDAHILIDGTVDFTSHALTVVRDAEDRGRGIEDRDPVLSVEPIAVGGGPGLHFDATDEYVRRLGKDPARTAKATFLTETFDLRMKLALEAHGELRHAALADIPTRLDQLWKDPRLTRAEKRHLLHAIWDDLGNDPDNAGAHTVVRDFARRHLPPKQAATFR